MIKQQGFTLIEVLAAFMVFSLVFAVAMQLTTVSIRNVALTKDYNQAALWAATKFAEIRHRQELKEGTENGSFNDHFYWKLDISLYESPWPLLEEQEGIDVSSGKKDINTSLDLIRLYLTVFWKSGKKQTSFSTLLLRKPDQQSTSLKGI